MMDIAADAHYPAAGAKANFSTMLDRAAGEVLTITRHGKPVAQLAPMPESEEAAIARRKKAIDDSFDYKREHKINIGSINEIRAMIREGRKY